MAKCSRCKMEMCDSSTKTCEAYKFVEFLDGTKMTPVPYSPPDSNIRCHDCGVAAGGLHHVGCDMEICPRCGGQFLGCSWFVSKSEMPETKKIRKTVLKPNHRYWRALGIRLNDLLIRSEMGCRSDLRFTISILKSLPGIDVEKTIEMFREFEVCCDCHLFHNVIGSNIMNTAVRSGYDQK
jgi:hypothetical protein